MMKPLTNNAPGIFLIIALMVFAIIPEPFLPTHAVGLRETLKRGGLNRADYERNERGYYETLLDVGRSFGSLGETIRVADFRQNLGPAVHSDEDGRPILTTDDMREYILKPDVDEIAYGTIWQTNSRGLRDKEYTTGDSANIIRIAILGDSITAGWGVTRPERFEDIWEVALNQQIATTGKTVEVWNFAVPGHSPSQRWKHFEIAGKGVKFDLVVYEATTSDPGWDARRMAHFMARGLSLDDPLFARFFAVSKFQPTHSPYDNGELLKPWQWTILQSIYEEMAARCEKAEIPLAYVLIPRVGSNLSKAEIRALITRAHAAGFDFVADLSDAYADYSPEELALSTGDYHPNIKGHSILARQWAESLAKWPALAEKLSKKANTK
jgi:hypothetical protein